MKGSLIIGLIALSFHAAAQSIILYKKDAVVWNLNQRISGALDGASAEVVTIHHNDSLFLVPVKDKKFIFDLALDDGENHIWAELNSGPMLLSSDSVMLRMGYVPKPLVLPFASVAKDIITLHAKTLANPRGIPLKFLWAPGIGNPQPVKILMGNDTSATVKIAQVQGNYFFDLLVVSGADTTRFQTYVTRKEKVVIPFQINDHRPTWINQAIVYQITPHAFTKDGTFDGITAKLPELKTLGINTIYLQPVYRTTGGGQGYDVTDYFSLRTDLGTEAQLRTLISSAKLLGLRVLFDFVPNHTSISHPYAESAKTYDSASHYYDYYQHRMDGVMYSSHYNKDADGFVYYFWKDLVNLNYDSEEVQRWIIEACKYWVREYDIDGYRFDAVWGVNARAPAFGLRLRNELKAIKPDIFLLAEDKPGDETFANGFDAAYDWTMDTSWVSQWSWAYQYHEKESRTIFNFPDAKKRAAMLREATISNTDAEKPVLRFMENNDLPRFGVHHTVEQVRMVAGLLLSLPGIPMLYNGQEVGVEAHPYTRHSVFTAGESIRSMQPELFDYYQKLIFLRQKFPALQSASIRDLRVSPANSILAFQRWSGRQNFIIVVNLDSMDMEATVDIRKALPGVPRQVKDVISGEKFPEQSAGSLRIPVKGYSVRWILLEL